MEKVKIILDADVLIHFSKAGKLSLLPTILPEYDHAILSAVYEETISIRTQIDNQMKFLKNMVLLPFEPTGQMRLEYAKLRSKYGKGESACMAFADLRTMSLAAAIFVTSRIIVQRKKSLI